MIKVSTLINLLKKNKSTFYAGVPDSVLKELSSSLQKMSKKNHIIATNEGAAVSIGIGHYLSTKKIPVIYMQNSGLSNALNPLISIAHEKVYSVPLILIIGWRGSPRVKDEPQHKKMGAIMINILDTLDIPHSVLSDNTYKEQIKNGLNKTFSESLELEGINQKNRFIHSDAAEGMMAFMDKRQPDYKNTLDA